MKVAYIIGTLNQGGMESLTLDICKRYTAEHFDVVCIYRHEGNYSVKFHDTGVQLIKINYTNILSYIWNIRNCIIEKKIDIVHAQTQSNALICILALLGLKIPIITTLHGFSFVKAKWLYRKIIYKWCKTILCVSYYQKRYYINKWKLPENNKLQVVYNGVNFSKLDQKYDVPDFLKKIDPAQPRKIKLAMVGNFVSVRSQSVVCKALAVLRERGIGNLDFYFIGKRNDKEPWRYDDCVSLVESNGLSECVHFMGGRDDVPAILQNIDGFVYSTNHDTFGIAVVEAMAAGLPVVVNDWDVMREITQNGKWAILYKSNDVEDCADKIANLIENISSYKEKAHFDSQKVRGEFSIENHIAQLKNVYMNCLAQ